MNRFMKWLMRLIIVLALLAFLGVAIGYFVLTRSIPDYNRDEAIKTSSYSAEILRDLQAIPHIYGETEEDALFALGFAHAQDRLWQMVSSRRVVQGRLSEIFGEQTIEVDKFFRTLDLWNLSNRAARSLDQDDLALLQAYSNGVNAYITDVNTNRSGSGSPEFLIFGRQISPWTPTDCLAMIKLMAYDLSGAAEKEILRAKLATILSGQDMRDIFYTTKLPANFDRLVFNDTQTSQYRPEGAAKIFNPKRGAGNAGASNAFIVAPGRSATGTSLLANDPHLTLTAPSIWMLAHIHIQSSGRDIYGGTIPGIPTVLIGHNRDLAWGLTTSYLDDQDLVVLKRSGTGYEKDGGIVPLQSETLQILVDGQDEAVEFTREVSEYGPIIPFGGPWKVEEIVPEGHAVALAWTALQEDDHSISAGFDLMRVSDVYQAMDALESFVAPSQIFSLADSQGNIAQMAGGQMPLRSNAHPSNGTLPAPNWLGEAGFENYLPTSQNPRLINPDDGLLIHTNNKFIDEAYPMHWSYDWGDVYRRLRAEELLGTRKFHTRSSMSEAQNDAISEAARVLLPLIAREFWFTPEQSKQKAEVLEMLANWDGEYDALLPEPLIFAAWLEELNSAIFSDELGELYNELGRVDPLRLERIFRNVDGSARWCDIKPTPKLEICPEIAEMALDRALEKLNDQYGDDFEEWRWGRAHHAVHKNRFLSRIPLFGGLTNIVQEQSGDTQTLLRLAYPGGLDYNFDANHGAGLRMVVDFSDMDHSEIVIATGQSGHVLSPHYDDLSTLWRAGEYLLMNTNRKVIEGNLKGRIAFVPEDAVIEGEN